MLFNSGISRFKKEVLRVLGKEKSKILRDRLEYLSYFLYRHATPIAVYQMGKVGSQSVYLSLKEVGYFPLFHFHYMDHLREQKPYHYSYLQRVLKHGQRLKIIALVREPVGRNLSAFAHDFHGYFGSRMQDHSLNELHNLFWQYDRHLNGINWFDTEFYNTLGLDIYSCQFDKKAGIGLFRSRNLEVLVIKLEISDEKKEDAIQSFASIPQFSLQKYNTAESKSRYKGNYKEFIHSIKISTEYIEAMYNSKFSRHFYSDMELQALRNKWLPE